MVNVHYVMNLREVKRNRRITLTTTMLQPFMTEEGFNQINDLLEMEWSDIDDFKRKNDSSVNP